MITLYHGSNVEVVTPLVGVGRVNLDFGRGFYLTSIRKQAVDWAITIASRRGRNQKGVISEYRFDKEKALEEGVRFKIFETYNMDWLEYVINCRKGREVYKQFDVVEGGVANDNVIDTVEDYEKGIITAEQALGQLKYKKINHQMCIINQTVVDKYLTYVKSIKLDQIYNMRDNVLWRKQTSIVMLLAKKLNIEPSQALDIFYSTKTAQQLVDPSTGLQLMSDLYIVEDIVAEINGTKM